MLAADEMAVQKRGGEGLPHVQIRGGTKRFYPTSKGAAAVLCWKSREDIPHVQGKRNPSKMVGTERGHQRADRMKPHSKTTSQSVTLTTVLSNSMKLSHAMWGHGRWTSHGGEV